jgi:hypothetical protein
VTIRSSISVFALLVIFGSVPAVAASAPPDTVTLAAAKKKHVVHHRRRPTAQPQGEIACGPGGCHRIPPNCHTEGSVLDWHGNPTGIDAVHCR